MRDLINIKGKDKAKINRGSSLCCVYYYYYYTSTIYNILETEISCYVHRYFCTFILKRAIVGEIKREIKREREST